jgi:predicted kinase
MGSVSVIDTTHADVERRRIIYTNAKRHHMRARFVRWHR